MKKPPSPKPTIPDEPGPAKPRTPKAATEKRAAAEPKAKKAAPTKPASAKKAASTKAAPAKKAASTKPASAKKPAAAKKAPAKRTTAKQPASTKPAPAKQPASAGAEIDAYLATWPAPTRDALSRLRALLRRTVPDAVEVISYQLPTLKLGKNILAYGGAKHHCALYPMSARIVARFQAELAGFETSKGTIRFQPDAPLPDDLVVRIVKARIEENLARG